MTISSKDSVMRVVRGQRERVDVISRLIYSKDVARGLFERYGVLADPGSRSF